MELFAFVGDVLTFHQDILARESRLVTATQRKSVMGPHMAERASDEFERLGMEFQILWGRNLQFIDCQNVFCKVSKYARVAHPEIEGEGGRVRAG